jgi:hypothetical protein
MPIKYQSDRSLANKKKYSIHSCFFQKNKKVGKNIEKENEKERRSLGLEFTPVHMHRC